MASLIDKCRELKNKNQLTCAIVADGGISSYSRAIKALALGADYVMIGSTFGKCFESASPFTKADFSHRDVIDGFGLEDLNEMRFDESLPEEKKKSYIGMYKPIKKVWGMSTRKAQLSIGLSQGKKKEDIKLKTSEGVEKQVNVEYTLHQWIENFTDYLRSSMSYCNSENLSEYIGKPTIMLMSEASKNAINK
jgi:GMP reductase